MSKQNYLTLLILTQPVLASNARGESTGNGQTLQHVTTQNGDLTVLSGYALRYAIRSALQGLGVPTWRTRDTSDSPSGFGYGPDFKASMDGAPPEHQFQYADTAAFGYMVAAKGSGKSGGVAKARSNIQVSDAVSTTPYSGEVGFAQGHKAGDGGLNPFTYERHYTRYQFSLTVNLEAYRKADRNLYIKQILQTLVELQVGGSQAAHAATLIPAAIVWRFHNAPGKGGLQVGFDKASIWTPENKVDLAPITAIANDLGFTFEAGGQDVSDLTIQEALSKIWTQVDAEPV